jgi:hypothetical protein
VGAGERVLPDAVQERLEAKAMVALENGDHARYEELQKQIARVQRVGE